jgi:predicted MPP superfamily phosphohydrolase
MHRFAHAVPTVRVVLGALAGTIVAVALAGRVHAPIGPFDTTVSARPSLRGVSTVRLAPLGSIELDTHTAPVAVDLRVDELRPDEAERIARDPDLLGDLEDDLARDARRALLELLARALAVGLVGGLIGALAARTRWRVAAAGAGVGALVTGVAAAATVVTFEPDAVAEPRYSGLLAVAPRAVGDVESIVESFDDYRAQLTDLVGNVVTLYRAAEGLPALDPGDDTIRLLHVSDIHNNPQAFDLVAELVRQFDIDAVADTGDLTDWGTDPEALLLARIERLEVPYVFVRGNHDSQGTADAVAAFDNAIVLDGDPADVAGLRLWGIADPRYTPDKDQPVGAGAERDRADAFAGPVARALRQDARGGPGDGAGDGSAGDGDRAAARIDLVMVHDARMAAEVGEIVPLVLAGHTHEAREGRIDDAVLLVEGSTGGAGLRGLQGEEPEPLACSVLYFDPDTRRLVAYDRVTVAGLGGSGARIERHVLTPPDEPAG